MNIGRIFKNPIIQLIINIKFHINQSIIMKFSHQNLINIYNIYKKKKNIPKMFVKILNLKLVLKNNNK